MSHIWVVEDEADIRELVLYALRAAGFDATGFADGAALWAAWDAGHKAAPAKPDLLLLDVMLPGESGLEILARLRRRPPHGALPVMMLTAKGSEHDKVRGLDQGADDYMTKPFGVTEMLSRVRALLRRSGLASGAADREVEHGGICLVPHQRTATIDGIPLALTYKEFELLHYMLLNAGIVLSRDKLLQNVWGYDFAGESRTLDMHINTLRRKLDKAAAAGGMISTLRNVGYKLE